MSLILAGSAQQSAGLVIEEIAGLEANGNALEIALDEDAHSGAGKVSAVAVNYVAVGDLGGDGVALVLSHGCHSAEYERQSNDGNNDFLHLFLLERYRFSVLGISPYLLQIHRALA